jgi:hypothetical protein
MNANARLHVRRLATSWDGRPELMRAWVAFFRRAMPMPPLPMLGILGSAFGLLGIVSSGFPPFFERLLGGIVPSGESHALWRFVLLVGVGAGMIATVPEAKAPEAPLFRMLPWARERHMTGLAMAAGAYALVIGVIMWLVAHDASVAFAAAGVVTLVMVSTVSANDVLARAPIAMLVLGVMGILVVVPTPLMALADLAPIVTGITSIAGALWMLAGAYAPSRVVRQRAGTLDITDVRELLPKRMRRLVDTPVPREEPPPVVNRTGTPQTYKQWMALRGSHELSLTAFATGVVMFGVVLPLIGYVFTTPQMSLLFVMMPFAEVSDRAHRLPTLSRSQRARWGFLHAAKLGLMRLVVVLAGTIAFAMWDPWPGRNDRARDMSGIELQAFAIAMFVWVLPTFIWFSTWLPQSGSATAMEDVVAKGFLRRRFWMVFINQFVVAVVVAGFISLALRPLSTVVSNWTIAAGVVGIAIVAHWICWRLVERRYLTKDLIK